METINLDEVFKIKKRKLPPEPLLHNKKIKFFTPQTANVEDLQQFTKEQMDEKKCLQEKVDHRSWFEKVFGD